MKPIAILCPGPSLPTTWSKWEEHPYPHTIAVNRAIDWYRAQWLVAGDRLTFERINKAPTTGLVTFPDVAREIHKAQGKGVYLRFLGCFIHQWTDLEQLAGEPPQWGSTAAISLALTLGATHIHMYGCDLTGRTEFDDRACPEETDRTPDRWKRERIALHRAFIHCRERGVILTQITPENPWNAT